MAIHWGGKGPGHVSRWPKAVGPVNTYSGATMLLDFLNPVLDPRITFSRGTNATLIDSTGRLTYAPNNLLVRSEEFDSASWNKFNGGVATAPSVTANAGVAPDGTTTADRIQFALNGGTTSTDRSLLSQSVTIATSVTYVFSIWVRSLTGTVSMGIGCDNVAGNTPITVTTSWQRFTLSGTASGTAGVVLLQLRGGQTPVQANAADVLVWGAQLEAVTYQTTPSTYVATTASAYYGPRFDYDPVTLAPRGLLIEEARTNLVTYSDQFNNAAWTKNNLNITINSSTSPDGTTNADTAVTAVGTAITGGSSSGFTFTAASYTQSAYVKAATNIRYLQLLWTSGGISVNHANFDLQTGTVVGGSYASATMTAVGNGWYRITMTSTAGAATGGMWLIAVPSAASARAATYVGNGTDSFLVWGLQLELGAFATSYIPTVASTVTRNADVATMTGTNFSSWYNSVAGSFVTAFDTVNAAGVGYIYSANAAGSINNSIYQTAYLNSTDNYVFSGGAQQARLQSGVIASNVPASTSLAYALDSFASSTNGSAVATDTSGLLPVGIDRINLGYSAGGASFLNGHIRTIAYFNTRLPNAQLQTLTAPSLATTLSLDFTSGSYNVGF